MQYPESGDGTGHEKTRPPYVGAQSQAADGPRYTQGGEQARGLASTDTVIKIIRCISSGTPACEVFCEEDVKSVAGKLASNEVCKILSVGDTMPIGNVQGRWYKVERNGQAVYCLYLPDRCTAPSQGGGVFCD